MTDIYVVNKLIETIENIQLSTYLNTLQYIVIPREQTPLARSMERHISLSSSEEEDDESSEFRQTFSLPVTECPQRG